MISTAGNLPPINHREHRRGNPANHGSDRNEDPDLTLLGAPLGGECLLHFIISPQYSFLSHVYIFIDLEYIFPSLVYLLIDIPC